MANRRLAQSIAAALAVGAIWCVGPAWADDSTDSFPHETHVEMGLECSECHFVDDAWTQPRPEVAICEQCHDLEELPPQLETVAAHSTDQLWAFSHEIHVGGAGLDCDSCHVPEAGYYGPPPVSMSACLDCHGDFGVEATCGQCHEAYVEDKAPGPGVSLLLDHTVSWEMRHGEISRISQEACGYCHQQPDDCQSCHLDVPPRSHTRLFKLQIHGLEAQVDRDNCTTCHAQPDFCAECHQQVEPISHSAGWGNPGNRHCMECHEPLADTTCALCHESLQAHFEVEPSDHVATWGEPLNTHCQSCHAPVANDPYCFTCHKDTASHEMPPASHGAGFGQPANQHCNSCHLPLDPLDCGVCHDGTPSHQTEAPLDTHTVVWGPPANQHCNSCHLPLADNPVCVVCHTAADHSQAPPPPSHAGGWGEPSNTHCQSCHLPLASTPDCAVCHQDTPSHREEPQSHRGGWAFPPRYEHCDSCHFPVTAEPDCYACHQQEAQHVTAPEMPFDHDARSDCMYCHPSVRPINHQVVDDNCVRCHQLP